MEPEAQTGLLGCEGRRWNDIPHTAEGAEHSRGYEEKCPDPSSLPGAEKHQPGTGRERRMGRKHPKRRPLVFIFPWNGMFEARPKSTLTKIVSFPRKGLWDMQLPQPGSALKERVPRA